MTHGEGAQPSQQVELTAEEKIKYTTAVLGFAGLTDYRNEIGSKTTADGTVIETSLEQGIMRCIDRIVDTTPGAEGLKMSRPEIRGYAASILGKALPETPS